MATEARTEQARYDNWHREAKSMSMRRFPDFFAKLMREPHTRESRGHAIAAIAEAAAHAFVNDSHTAGISVGQSRNVAELFVKHWLAMGENPVWVVDYRDLLFPQNERTFTSIPKAVWTWLQAQAAAMLKDPVETQTMNPWVKSHLEAIADGKPPFGLRAHSDVPGKRGRKRKDSRENVA